MTSELRIARERERRPALALLYGYFPDSERRRRIASALTLFGRGEIAPEGLVVASAGRQLEGAVLAIPLAGASALLYPPQTLAGDPGLENRLLAHVLGWLHQRGTRLAQALALASDLEQYAALPRAGFVHLGRLWYLHHDLETIPSAPGPPFRLVPYRETGSSFGQTLLASYEGTLDFPELTGWRTLDEILAGHRGMTRHDPALWWLIEADGKNAGVALVGPLADSQEWDLSYLGLVPAARGRGLGRAVLSEILRRATGSASRMILAVDERNGPAWRLYRGAGFVPDESREVFLKLGLGPGDRPVSATAPVLPSAPVS
jgi:ribosomal protein S18 acetylase RimI-like enzyme